MGLTDDLVRLDGLRRDGVLTDEEFARAKAAVLSAPVDVSGPPPLPRDGAARRARRDAAPDDPDEDAADDPNEDAADDDDDDTRDDRGPARPFRRDAAEQARAERQWSMYIHFSVLAGVIVPLAGFILPIVLWLTKRDELPGVDAHGKAVAKWLISALIYGVASTILVFALVGIPLLVALAVLSILFPIVGGLRAGEGRLWTYPLSIRFIR
jgi:hypothetical protein